VAELTPIPSARQTASAQDYKPVSGYAVAATVVAGAFVLLLLLVVANALLTKRSALEYPLLVLPAVGLVLAILARSHIKNSEGTRIGMKLANAAWWVSVLGGAGYGAYLYANEFVLERESAGVADKFFNELKEGRIESSFLHLVPPEERDRVSPDAGEGFAVAYAKSGFFEFRRHDIVRLLKRNGKAATIERVGVKDVKQAEGAFHATHIYNLECPDGRFEIQVKMTATEPKRGGKPVWQIPSRPAPNIAVKALELSEYGRMTMELELEAFQFARMWTMHLSQNHPVMAQGMTVPETDRVAMDQAIIAAAVTAGGPAFAAPLSPDLLPAERRQARRVALYGPGLLAGGPAVSPARVSQLAFDDLMDQDFFQRDEAKSPYPVEKLAKLRELWASPRLGLAQSPRVMFDVMVTPEAPTMRLTANEMWVEMPAELFENAVTFDRCTIGVVCDNPLVVAALNAAKAKGLNSLAATSGGAASLPERQWRIGWVRSDLEAMPVVAAPSAAKGP
jgi:hypothetical protein